MVLLFGLCLSFFISSIVQKKGTGVILVIAIYFILTILSVFPYIDIYNPMYGLTLSNNIITSIDYKLSDYLIKGYNQSKRIQTLELQKQYGQ